MLVNLQTLKLNCCRQLTELPKSIVFMCNLRHLHINSCLELRSMPTGLSQLQNLRTITKYVVNSSTGSEIRELKQLNLGGRLALYNLHKVKNAGIAKEVNLDSKPNIISLALCWSASDYHSYYAEEPAENAEEVLEALKPHYGVKMLSIAHYPGVKFPLWLREVQEFRNLIEVRLEDCRGCLQLPPLDQLPSLEVLHLRQMEGIRHISNSLKSSAVQAFPALKNLVLNNMRNLEGWFADEEKEAVQSFFPSLILMKIDECPKLTTMPYIPTLEDLLIVRASNETDTSHFSRERVFFKQLKSLNILTIERCEELALMLGDEEETRAMSKSLQKITICYCNQFVSTPEIWNLPFVKHLEIYGCSTLVSWPLIILQDGGLPCLEVLDLLYCDALLELPECLTLRLNVISCPCITSLNAAPKCLTELHVQDCWELVSLSKDMGHLGSLKHIELNHCPKLRTFPEGLQQLLRQLKGLTIGDCAELERRCKPGGEYSRLVSEIPSTDISSTAPKRNTGK
ncbi:putative leucine-rich repeat domain superfamily [Dioscorea sansibarensis]